MGKGEWLSILNLDWGDWNSIIGVQCITKFVQMCRLYILSNLLGFESTVYLIERLMTNILLSMTDLVAWFSTIFSFIKHKEIR